MTFKSYLILKVEKLERLKTSHIVFKQLHVKNNIFFLRIYYLFLADNGKKCIVSPVH